MSFLRKQESRIVGVDSKIDPKKFMKIQNEKSKLKYVLKNSWDILFQSILSKRVKINKEASLQLHYSAILKEFGELMCTKPKEIFNIELESKYEKKNIDIVCGFDKCKAAIELKCFRKSSNRAVDTDMYDVLKDLERLISYKDFQLKLFICLTDNRYYLEGEHSGHSRAVSLKNNRLLSSGKIIKPSWAGKWKNKSRDKPIILNQDIKLSWEESENWYYLFLDL